jgi:hypothetical protein
MIERPDSTELNAYVDGELPPDQAARVAQAIADDRELAKEVAALLRLKTATMAAFDREPPALPQAKRKTVRIGTAVWVASTTLAAVLIAATIGFLTTVPSHTGPDRIIALMNGWSRDSAPSPRSRPLSRTREAKDKSLATLLQGLADLQLTIIRSEEAADGMAFDLLGPSGCRLAVWTGPSSINLDTVPALQSRLRTRAAVIWQADNAQFLLVSHNTPEQRFAAMAAALQRATQDPSPMDGVALSLVAKARSQGSPCVT